MPHQPGRLFSLCFLSALLFSLFPVAAATPAEEAYQRAAQAMQLGKVHAAVSELRMSVRLEPQRPEFQYALALALRRLGDWESAAASIRKCLQLQPSFQGANYQLRAISFAVVARFVGEDCHAQVESSHAATLITNAAPSLRGTLYLAVVTSEEDPRPLQAARRRVEQAAREQLSELQSAHRRRWAGFWRKSYVQIPQDYLENLYYFSLYSLASSSQGKYPPHHCGGLWFWNHDIRRWGHYYHWNVQQQYWPVHASNHAELAEPYLDFRFQTLPQARAYAKQVHSRVGAAYSDVTDRWGRGTIHSHVSHIFTTTAQIAMDFWRHYVYTQDRDFLQERAYVMMRESVRFYLETVKTEPDGMYHIPRSTCYENPIEQKDTITDLAMIRTLFPSFIEASEILQVDPDLRGQCRKVVDQLTGFLVLDDAKDENGRELGRVFGSGIPLEDTFAGPDVNHGLHKKRAVKKGEPMFNISFFCETAPIFPSGVIGLNQRDTELFEVAKETVKELQKGPSWNLHPIISAARLGMSEVALAGLTYIVERFQKAPQGFFAELTLPNEYSLDLTEIATPVKILNGQRTKERAALPKRWFDMPDLEIGGVLMTTINEMLLQSHDGTIRICPGRPEEWKEASFRLRAAGAFLVTGSVRDGVIQPFVIESLAGKRCKLVSPWEQERVRLRDLVNGDLLSVSGTTVEFNTTPEGRYLAFREGSIEKLPEPLPPGQTSNRAPKEWHGRQLGIPRHF